MATASELNLGLGEIIRIDNNRLVQILKKENDGGIIIQYIETGNKLKNGSRQYISKNYTGFTRLFE
jgi:hypothetical protein